jgi:hypothetical protein
MRILLLNQCFLRRKYPTEVKSRLFQNDYEMLLRCYVNTSSKVWAGRYIVFGRPTGGTTMRRKPKSSCLLLKIYVNRHKVDCFERQIPVVYFGVCL